MHLKAASGSSAGGARLVRDEEAVGSNPTCPTLLRAWDLNRRSAERERGKPPWMAAPATEAARRKVQEEPFGEKSHLPDF